MPIKFADEIIKDIEKRGAVKIPNGNLTGEEFEKWLKNNLGGKHDK